MDYLLAVLRATPDSELPEVFSGLFLREDRQPHNVIEALDVLRPEPRFLEPPSVKGRALEAVPGEVRESPVAKLADLLG
jgi:hypothetical protein